MSPFGRWRSTIFWSLVWLVIVILVLDWVVDQIKRLGPWLIGGLVIGAVVVGVVWWRRRRGYY